MSHYLGSASSAGGWMAGESPLDGDGFVFIKADDTEIDQKQQKVRSSSSPNEGRPSAPPNGAQRTGPPKKLPPDVTAHPIQARITLLPASVLGIRLNRKRCEDAILLSAVVFAIYKLAYGWGEWAVAGGELQGLLPQLTPQNSRPSSSSASCM